MKCLIIAGGELRENFRAVLTETAAAADMVICADRGYGYAKELGIVPDVLLGDFDSYTGELPEGIELHRSVPEKDDTDTMLAVKLAISMGADEITLCCALGGRFDHTMANVQTLVYALENGCRMTIADSCNVITVQGAERREYLRREGEYFSVFAYTPAADIRELSGVKYPLRAHTLTASFPLGVSNEITEERAVLDVASGTVVVVRSAAG